MIHSFLIIGQSNMAGRGNMNEAEPINDSRLLVLRNGRWQGLHRPVNFDRCFSGVCLAETFVEKYAEDKNVLTGIIPCADGGTRIDQWKKGSLLYDHAVCQAKLAQRTSTIAGILWHQGESDCEENLYPQYRSKLTYLMSALREELQLYDVPLLLGGLGDYLAESSERSFANYRYINEALQKYAAETAMTGFVSAKGLKSKADCLHFDTKSLQEFGLRYYEVFKQLEDKNKVFVEKPEMDLADRSILERL